MQSPIASKMLGDLTPHLFPIQVGPVEGHAFMLKWSSKQEPLPGLYPDWSSAEHARLNFGSTKSDYGSLQLVAVRWLVMPPPPMCAAQAFAASAAQHDLR